MAQTFTDKLAAAERANDSLLCVGLDPEPAKFPGAWQRRRLAHLRLLRRHRRRHQGPGHRLQAADRLLRRAARRRPARAADGAHPQGGAGRAGDPGRQARRHRQPPPSSTRCEAFERYRADAVTLSPFMGFDSIEPYLRYDGKGLILLCRTSNPGGADLQAQRLATGDLLYEHIARLAQGPWNRGGQLGLVVGATFPAEIAARARARADPAAADPRRRRAGRRRRSHGARRLAACGRTHDRHDHRQFLARRCCTPVAAMSSPRPPGPRHRTHAARTGSGAGGVNLDDGPRRLAARLARHAGETQPCESAQYLPTRAARPAPSSSAASSPPPPQPSPAARCWWSSADTEPMLRAGLGLANVLIAGLALAAMRWRNRRAELAMLVVCAGGLAIIAGDGGAQRLGLEHPGDGLPADHGADARRDDRRAGRGAGRRGRRRLGARHGMGRACALDRRRLRAGRRCRCRAA